MNLKVPMSDHRIAKIKELEASGDGGAGSKKTVVIAYYKQHPNESMGQIAKALNMNQATVRYAIMSLSKGGEPKTPKQKMITLPEEHMRANEVEAFCPKCSKPVKAHVYSIELHIETYKHNAIGTCKCGCHFSYKVD